MKKSMLKDIALSIEGRDAQVVLSGDNTRSGGKEADQAAEVIENLFSSADQYDTLTFKVVDRSDPRHTLWCFKLHLHENEKYVLDLVGGEFQDGLSER